MHESRGEAKRLAGMMSSWHECCKQECSNSVLNQSEGSTETYAVRTEQLRRSLSAAACSRQAQTPLRRLKLQRAVRAVATAHAAVQERSPTALQRCLAALLASRRLRCIQPALEAFASTAQADRPGRQPCGRIRGQCRIASMPKAIAWGLPARGWASACAGWLPLRRSRAELDAMLSALRLLASSSMHAPLIPAHPTRRLAYGRLSALRWYLCTDAYRSMRPSLPDPTSQAPVKPLHT